MRRINRWTRGYWFTEKGKRRWSDPIVGVGGAKLLGDRAFLDFADLIEIRCLSVLRDKHISWATIRLVSVRGKQVLQTGYPLSSGRFIVAGQSLLADLGDGDLMDLARDQMVFRELVLGGFRKNVHYDSKDTPQWWTPLGDDRTVMVHPARAFGAPVVIPGGIRTRILYGSYKAEGSFEEVADWYNVSVGAVKDAVEFEETLRVAA
jgi:uncharacterized protein (DUF433 family)